MRLVYHTYMFLCICCGWWLAPSQGVGLISDPHPSDGDEARDYLNITALGADQGHQGCHASHLCQPGFIETQGLHVEGKTGERQRLPLDMDAGAGSSAEDMIVPYLHQFDLMEGAQADTDEDLIEPCLHQDHQKDEARVKADEDMSEPYLRQDNPKEEARGGTGKDTTDPCVYRGNRKDEAQTTTAQDMTEPYRHHEGRGPGDRRR